MASMPHGRLGPPLWSFAADAHDCIMVLVRLDRPHTSSWRDAAPVGGLPLRSLWLIPPGAPCRGPQTEPDGGKKPEKKRLTEKAPYKSADQVQITAAYSRYGVAHWLSRPRLSTVAPYPSSDLPPPSAASRPCRRLGRRHDRSSIDPTLGQQCPDDPGHLVGQRHPHQQGRLAGEHAPQPRPSRNPLARGPAGHRAGANDQQASERALPHLGGPAEPLLAPAGALNRGQPEPRGEIATAPERVGRWGQCREGRRCHSPDPRDGHQPARDSALLRLPRDLSVEHGDALIEGLQLLHQDAQDHASRMRQIGRGIVHEGDELGHMKGPFGRNDAELSQMASQGIDGLGALANQQVSRAEHNGCGLRLLTFHGHEAHGGPLGGLADRLSIGHVVLLALDERLHVRRRDQLHRVAELGDLAAPIMRAATGLHGHRAGRKCCEERQKLGAAQLLAKDNSSRAVGSVQLKDVLGEIQSDGAHRVHGRLLEWPGTPSLWHTTAAGGVHTITATGKRRNRYLNLYPIWEMPPFKNCGLVTLERTAVVYLAAYARVCDRFPPTCTYPGCAHCRMQIAYA